MQFEICCGTDDANHVDDNDGVDSNGYSINDNDTDDDDDDNDNDDNDNDDDDDADDNYVAAVDIDIV